jgi:hypothetical protein
MLNTTLNSIRKFSNPQNSSSVIRLFDSVYINAYNLYNRDDKNLHNECFKNTQSVMIKIMEILDIFNIPTCPEFLD